jgi:hypothetical protein
MAKAPKAAAPEATAIELPPLDVRLLHLRLIGDSPLICHAWSHKAKQGMLDKQMKRAKAAKEAKDPEADFLASLYPIEGGGYGFPAVAFKSAAVSACRFSDGLKMTNVRGAFHVIGELVPITGKPTPREDMVRLPSFTADIRFRGEFKTWSANLAIRFNAGALSAEQIVNLFSMAGFGIGVGEWRPERDGSFGMFHVASEKEAK